MKQSGKVVMLLFLTAVFVTFTRCEDDVKVMETPPSFQVIAFDALPAAIQSKITTTEQALKSSFAHKNDKPFGTVIPTGIHRRLKPDGSASYTLGITRTNEGLYYDNLVINRDAGGNLKTHIIRYQPEALWFYQHKTAGLGYEAYSGAITVFNEAGGLLSSVNLISGKVEKEAAKTVSSKTNAATNCEILDVEYVGGCAGEDYCWWNEIIITVDCTGTGGGTGGYEEDDGLNDGVNDPGGEEGGGSGPGGGGAGGNGGLGDPIDTVPVEEEAQIIIDPEFSEDYPCQAAIVQEVYSNCTPLSQLFQDIFESNDHVNVTFTAEDLNNIFEGAQTNGGIPHNYTTTLNSERLEQSTELDLVNNTTHEYVHALMFHYFYSGQFQLTGAGNPPTYAELVQGFTKHRADFHSEANQHEYMTSLVNDIAEVTYTWATDNGYAPGDFTAYDTDPADTIDGLKEFLRQLAWNGLTDTPTFEVLYPQYSPEELQIRKIIQDEAFPNDGSSTPKGNFPTPCN